MTIITAYLLTILIFLAIDLLWLGVIAKKYYFKSLGFIMSDTIKYSVAAVFYLFYGLAIVIFAVYPALQNNNLWYASIYGALLGFTAYGTYNFTNMATLKNWPIQMSIIDLIWGTFLTSLTASLAMIATSQIL